jgi:hypothetical protein
MARGDPRATSPWTLVRLVLLVAALFGALLTVLFRVVPLRSEARARAAAARRADAGPPSYGRVRIVDVPRGAVATLDGDPIAAATQEPAADARGCWRFAGAGDGGATDVVRCRLLSEEYHTFGVREEGREPDSWFVAIPLNNGEAVLVH